MTLLQVLYKQLIIDRPHAIDGWLEEYKEFTNDVAVVRAALQRGLHLADPQAYAGTGFEREANQFKAFAEQLIYARYNGVSSRGQSVLARSDFDQFIANNLFVEAIEALIREPSPATFQVFRERWLGFEKGSRPVLLNRTLAACTTDVSTTADEGKFETVYQWLLSKKLIAAPDQPAEDWYAKNLHLVAQLRERLADDAVPETKEVQKINIFVWELYTYMANPFSLKKQVVRYGPPGTGKTYEALLQAQLQFDLWRAEFDPDSALNPDGHIQKVQFHPSYGYEDFMEGLRPDIVDGQSRLRLQNGIFKELCRRAARWELDVLRVCPEFEKDFTKVWAVLTIGELLPHKAKLGEHWEVLLKQNGNQNVADAVPPYFLIIDEMNRAELSRVLGELMFCLEYRGIKGAVQTQYARLNDAVTGMVEKDGGFLFFVPHNVYVIGTMNTIDRSVESFDFALRRRFRWEPVLPQMEVLRHHLLQTKPRGWLELAHNLECLNEAISQETLLGPDFQIGHTYLMELNYPRELGHPQVRSKVWEDFIAPLLEEYLRGTGKAAELNESFKHAFGIR